MKNTKIFEVKNLTVQTTEGKKILENINFFINKKEKVLLEGENGIGKSTLINAIFKNPNYKIQSQGVFFYDLNNKGFDNKQAIIDIQDFETQNIAKLGMFYAMQTLPEISGLSTIKFLYKAYQNLHSHKDDFTKMDILSFKKQLLSYCQEFDIDADLIDRDLNVGFSGGEKKQAMLLHILILKPKIIFADEPESGVDKSATDKVYKVFNYLVKNESSSLFIISHNEKAEQKLKVDRKYILKYDQNINKILEEIKVDNNDN